MLTVDLGTTFFKAAVFNDAGRLLALRRVATPVARPAPDRWEVPVPAFLDAVTGLVRGLTADRPELAGRIAGTCFSTQTNSFVLLDDLDRPITPLILWPDRRADDHAGEMEALGRVPGFTRRTGLPGWTAEFMAAKLLWFQRHHADRWARLRRLCLISDYLTLWLTGRHVTEAGATGLTGLLDIHTLDWRTDALDALDLPRTALPRVERAGTVLGRLLPGPARALGLSESCRFVVGCLDQYAGAIGSGNVRPGGLTETTGTVLAAVRCADAFRDAPPPEVYQGPSFAPGLYFQMAFGSTSANLLEHYRGTLPDRPSYDELGALAAQVPPGADGYRIPPLGHHGDLDALFAALPPPPSRGHMVRAIMETVAYALAGQVEALCGDRRPPEVRSGGGAARSELWTRIKADVLNLPVTVSACEEPTSRGAALLAAHGLLGDPPADLADRWTGGERRCEPDPEGHRRYAALRADHSAAPAAPRRSSAR